MEAVGDTRNRIFPGVCRPVPDYYATHGVLARPRICEVRVGPFL